MDALKDMGEKRMRDPTRQLESIIDGLLSGGQLEIYANVMWQLRDGYLVATLKAEEPNRQLEVRIELRKNPRITKFSFQLLVNNTPARRYCSRHPHTNPSDCTANPNSHFPEQHKHAWSDATGDECVYLPDDFATNPIEDAFYSFCEECGIAFQGVWNDPPQSQMGLETIA